METSTQIIIKHIFEKAHIAGLNAGHNCNPEPMGVCNGDKLVEIVDDGMCGMAWVHLKYNTEMNRKVINWGKKEKVLSKVSDGFWYWVGDFNQSYERKMAYARAFAKVLNDAGIECRACGRVD